MKLFLPLCLALLLAGCGSAPPAETEVPTLIIPEITEAQTLPPETEPAPTLPPEEALLQSMTLRQKVGQLFLVRPDALDLSQSPAQVEDPNSPAITEVSAIRSALEQYPVGGIVQFSKNIQSPDQLLSFNRELLEAMPITPFLAVDEEGGIVARLARHPGFDLPRYQSAGAVGTQGPAAAFEMGSTIGSYLKDYGFNMDFAPVADVNTNPRNPVIGNRAFSSDPQVAADCAGAAAEGLRQAGIIPVFKHFPGHGDTGEDSHKKLALSNKTVDQMLECEWIPFRQATDTDCIMVGHIALPQVTGELVPATLSYSIVAGLLRQHLGFHGLVITDSMSMGAITQEHSSSEAALLALQAGCDLILMPWDLPEAFDGVVAAVEDGSYPEYQLDATVLKILRFKLDHGIVSPIQ